MEVPTRAELQKLKVVDLRKRLTKLSLPISGLKKDDLISALIKHYEEERDAAKQQEEGGGEGQEGEGEEEEEEGSPHMLVSIDRSKTSDDEAMDVQTRPPSDPEQPPAAAAAEEVEEMDTDAPPPDSAGPPVTTPPDEGREENVIPQEDLSTPQEEFVPPQEKILAPQVEKSPPLVPQEIQSQAPQEDFPPQADQGMEQSLPREEQMPPQIEQPSQPEPPQPEPPQIEQLEPPQPEPPQIEQLEPPQPEPPQIEQLEPPQPEPPQIEQLEPPQPEPPRIEQPEPPQVEQPEPPQQEPPQVIAAPQVTTPPEIVPPPIKDERPMETDEIPQEVKTEPVPTPPVEIPPAEVAPPPHIDPAVKQEVTMPTQQPRPQTATMQPLFPPPPHQQNVAPPSLMSQPVPLMTTPTSILEAANIQPVTSSDYYSGSDSGISSSGGVRESEKSSGGGSQQQRPPVSRSVPQSWSAAKPEAGEKAEKRKKKKKKRKRRRHDQQQSSEAAAAAATKEQDVVVEYVQEDILKPGDPNYRQFHKILESFRISEPEQPEKPAKPANPDEPLSVSELVAQAAEKSKKMAARELPSDDEEEEEEEKKEEPKMSKKKLRKLNRLTVAQLKQLVERPDVVEMHDVTAMDPRLLIHLKSTRNSVPVPRHWSYKRKYLQGKRGIEKPPFDLPDFIKSTGVMEMRQALEDKEDAKSLKQKTRERVRPKMGKLTIDYQKLHDAFFRFQTKPKMTIHGDLYHEGKEFETRLRQKKPGDPSDELRRALGMPTGLGKHKFPPPWLVAMQRYGPPPSYPNLKIPGLNAAIPENCSFGYFVGGWGKPPVDEHGHPLYGDVFGLEQPEGGGRRVREVEEVDKSLWGELESEEEEEEDEDEESEEAASPKPEDLAAGLITPMEGLVTPSGLTSIPAGMETPDMIQLRKKKIEEAMEQGGETPALYTVIPEMPMAVGGAMMGSSHAYDVATAGSAPKKAGAVEVALDPDELDLDTATIAARYEEQVREKRNAIQKEDLSDMVAEHAAKQKKRKRAAGDSAAGGKAAKKLKEFKF